MARTAVELLREAFEAFNSEDVDRIVAVTAADFEGVVPPELSAEPDTYRGHSGIRRYFESFQEVMDDIRFELDEFWEAGESVVAVVRLTAKGRQTEIAVEQRLAQVWTVRDGKIRRAYAYTSLAEAFEAAGLSGQA